ATVPYFFCPAHRRQVAPYYLDPTEVTVAAYRQADLDLPRSFVARYTPPPEDFARYPVTFVDFDEARAFAEAAGQRRPTETEYEYAATWGGTRRFPWGDDERRAENRWGPCPVGQPAFDCLPTRPPVFGLFSNVAEWTDSMGRSYSPDLHPALLRSQKGGEA